MMNRTKAKRRKAGGWDAFINDRVIGTFASKSEAENAANRLDDAERNRGFYRHWEGPLDVTKLWVGLKRLL